MYVLHATQILDYTQYYLNLPEANSNGKANWMTEYTLLEYYDLKEISAIILHDLADRFTQSNENAFVRYVARDETDRLASIWARVYTYLQNHINPSSLNIGLDYILNRVFHIADIFFLAFLQNWNKIQRKRIMLIQK